MKAQSIIGLMFGAAGISFASAYIYFNHIPCETVVPHVSTVSFDADLDQLKAAMTVIRDRIPQLSKLATDTIAECDSMRALFKRTLVPSPDLSIDFILRTHEDPLRQHVHEDYPRSFKLTRKVIIRGNYDAVSMEGSVFDGFSIEAREKEVYARAMYADLPPNLAAIIKPRQPKPVDQIRADLYDFVAGQSDAEHDDFLKLEYEGVPFKAGEDIVLTTLMGDLVSGQLTVKGPAEGKLEMIVQRLRSAYVIARTIDTLRASNGHRGAIAFGYLHVKQFRDIASKLGLKARVLDASLADMHAMAPYLYD